MVRSTLGRSFQMALSSINVGATRHFMNLFGLIVGDTSKARKGTSQQEIFRFFRPMDETWALSRVLSGFVRWTSR